MINLKRAIWLLVHTGRGTGEDIGWRWKLTSFDEGDMEGVEDPVSGRIPQPVSLRVWSISYKDAGD